MFRSRKRKVSPDKKSDKSKKLKVSSKIFRSPSSTKTNSEAKAKVSKLLPEGYDSIILTASTKPVESFEENEAVFGCVRLPILTKEDAMVWVKKFERKTFTSYRTQKTWKKDVNTGLFKRKYICNVRNKDLAGQAATTTCKGSIIFTIKDQEEIQANPDYYLRDYPSQVIIHFCHNHKIDPDSYMKNLRPTAELRIIFGTYFAKGHSPFSALICHKCDLHSSYGADFYNVVSNGAICPSYNWCFHEYEKFFMRKFVEPPEDKLYEKLQDMVSQYNAKWRSECAIISYNPLFVLSICTPLMRSIFRSGFAEELITVRCFSTPKTVPKRQKLILFLCHTPIGSLPFGVVATLAEDTENVCEGIRTLIKMFGVATYSPKTIITDENAVTSKALKRCFPNAQVLFNEFQMLQSIWRIIRVVCTDDDEEFQALYNLFLVTLNSSSEEEFKKNFDSLLVYAEKYPKLTNFLKYFKLRSNSYVLYARPKIEFNTDVLNYTDSGTIILQDVSIKYGNFFNIVQLFDFLSKSYVDHYERKLNKIVEGDLKGFFKTNFYVPLSKIANFTCEKISDTEFLVSLNEMKFFVNAELDTCTCQVGVHGGSCVHQYIVEKNLGLVPECYTPLCDDMLEIFQNILREKNIKPPIPDSDHLSELGSALDSLKSELEAPDTDDFSDMVSSVCCSEISNFSGMPHDMDHLGPLDEIFLVPPDINDSFTDITDDIMSPLVLSEFDDTNEENEDFLDDSEQYNKESGELEPIQSSSLQETEHYQNNVFVEVLPTNIEQSPGVFSNHDNPGNVIIYEYNEEDIKCNNEIEIEEQRGNVEREAMVHIPTDAAVVLSTDAEEYNIIENDTSGIESPVVYTYSGENQGQGEFYEEVMTENDRKTAEIAEFLTNLPDTNNSNQHAISTEQQHYSVDENNESESQNIVDTEKSKINQDHQTLSNGVVVVRNEEYFTEYKVLENNVLSIVTEGKDGLSDDIKEDVSNRGNYEVTSPQSAQNLITDSYEDNNLIMMSPNDLFDDNQKEEPDLDIDKQDPKINVLSSVVIKPPVNYPLNLNAIKDKTLRKVKKDRIKINESRTTQSADTVFVHDPGKCEPRKIVLPIVRDSKYRSDLMESGNKTHERDVIKLYCNQSGEKSLPNDSEQNEIETFKQEVVSSKTLLEKTFKEDSVKEDMLQLNTHQLTQSADSFQLSDKCLLDAKTSFQESDKEVSGSKELTLVVSKGNLQQYNKELSKNLQDIKTKIDKQTKKLSNSKETVLEESKSHSSEVDEDVSDNEIDSKKSDLEEFVLADCDAEELAKNEFVEIIEIDSDGLEELASENYDLTLISSDIPSKPTCSKALASQKSSLKVTPLKDVPIDLLPFKALPKKNDSPSSTCLPLRDFMSKITPTKISHQKKLSFEKNELKETAANKNINRELLLPVSNNAEFLQEQLTTTFSQLENLLGRNNFKESVKKFLAKNVSCSSSDGSSNEADQVMDKVKKIGNTKTLKKINKPQLNQSKTAREGIEAKVKLHSKKDIKTTQENNEIYPLQSIGETTKNNKKLKKPSQLKQKSYDNILATSVQSLNNEEFIYKNVEKDVQLNIWKNTSKEFKEISQLKDNTERKCSTSMSSDNSSSNEMLLSDFEDSSDYFESFSSGVDEFSEDELYESQFLSDDVGSDKSDTNVEKVASKRLPARKNKTSTLIGKTLRRSKTSTDYSSDECADQVDSSGLKDKVEVHHKPLPNFTSRTESSQEESKYSKVRYKMQRKADKSISSNIHSNSNSSYDWVGRFGSSSSSDEDHFRGHGTAKIESTGQFQESRKPLLEKTNISTSKSHSADNAVDTTEYANISDIRYKEHDEDNIHQKTNKPSTKAQKFIDQSSCSDDNSDELIDRVGSTTKNKGKPTHKPNIKYSTKNQKTNNMDVPVLKETRGYPSKNPLEVDQRIKLHIGSTVTDQGTTLNTTVLEKSNQSLKKINQNSVSQIKTGNESRRLTSGQKLNPKMFNIKNKKLSTTTLRLDSLPSLLSQSYNQRLARGSFINSIFRNNKETIKPHLSVSDNSTDKNNTSKNICETPIFVRASEKVQTVGAVKTSNSTHHLSINDISTNNNNTAENIGKARGRNINSRLQNNEETIKLRLSDNNNSTGKNNTSKNIYKAPIVVKTSKKVQTVGSVEALKCSSSNKSNIVGNVAHVPIVSKPSTKKQSLEKVRPAHHLPTNDSSTIKNNSSQNVSKESIVHKEPDKVEVSEKRKPVKSTHNLRSRYIPTKESNSTANVPKAPTVQKSLDKVETLEKMKQKKSIRNLSVDSIKSSSFKKVSMTPVVHRACDKETSEEIKPAKLDYDLQSRDKSLVKNILYLSEAPKVASMSDKIQNSGNSKPINLVVGLQNMPVCRKPVGKDVKELENILTSDKDIDQDLSSDVYDVGSESNIKPSSILQNQDLSFLFDDPRFETIVEEDTESSLPVLKPNDNDSKISQSTAAQNDMLTLLIYTNGPKSGQNLRKINPTPRRELRKILPKPEFGSIQHNIKPLDFIWPKPGSSTFGLPPTIISQTPKTETNNENVNKHNSMSVIQTQKRNIETCLSGKSGDDLNNGDPLELKIPKVEQRGKIVTQVSTSRKQMAAENGEESRNKNQTLRSRSNSNVKKELEIRRENISNKISFKKKDKITQEVNIRKILIPNKRKKVEIQNKHVIDAVKDIATVIHKSDMKITLGKQTTPNQCNQNQKSLSKNSSKSDVEMVSILNSRKDLKITPLKKLSNIASHKKQVICNRRDQFLKTGFKALQPDFSITKITSIKNSNQKHKNTLTDSRSKLTKTSTLGLESTENISTAKVSLDYKSDDFENSISASILEKRPYVKEKLKDSNAKKEETIISSTPKKSIGYEDAFKKFLETSTHWHLNKQRGESISDFEKDIDDSDWESSRESRRRTKSVSSQKKQTLYNKIPPSGGMKKSVSWAEGLNIIEYVKESDSDSDDSEIKGISKKLEVDRGKRKKTNITQPSSSKSRDKPISRQKGQLNLRSNNKDVINSRAQNIYVRKRSASSNDLETNLINGVQGRRRSLTRNVDLITICNRVSRLSKCESVAAISKTRSRSSTRIKNFESELIVLLERNKEIDQMCQALEKRPSEILTSRRTGRIGYKELLHRARLSKNF